MNTSTAAARLAELGHSTRLTIYKYLVKMGEAGAPVGEIQKVLDIPGSTLSHHLSRLVQVGLVRQMREGRILYCQPQYDTLEELIDFLKAECCTGRKRENEEE